MSEKQKPQADVTSRTSPFLKGMGSALEIMPAPSRIEISNHTSSFEELWSEASSFVVNTMRQVIGEVDNRQKAGDSQERYLPK